MIESKTINKGYFSSRNQIIMWINQSLLLQLTSIQQLGTGAVYCQLLDALYPGRVPLNKINWKAKFEYQFTPNYKILQVAFDHLGIEKQLDVQKLRKCKQTANLEVIQWLKRFIDLQGGIDEQYNPILRRGGVQVDLNLGFKRNNVFKNKQNSFKQTLMGSMNLIPSIKISQNKLRNSFKPLTSNRLNSPKRCQTSNYWTRRTMFSLADVPFIEQLDQII